MAAATLAACTTSPIGAPPPDVVYAMSECDRYRAHGIGDCTYVDHVMRFEQIREPDPDADPIAEMHVHSFILGDWCVEHTHLPGRPLGQYWYVPLEGEPVEVCCDYVSVYRREVPAGSRES